MRSFCSSRHPTSRFTVPPTDLGRLSGSLIGSSLAPVCYDLARVDLRNQSTFHMGRRRLPHGRLLPELSSAAPSRRLRPSWAKSWVARVRFPPPPSYGQFRKQLQKWGCFVVGSSLGADASSRIAPRRPRAPRDSSD